MQIFIEVLKLIAVSLLPGGVSLLIYISLKKVKGLDKINCVLKDIIIGIIFTFVAMLPFYYGMNYMNIFHFDREIIYCFGPILAAPIISTFIFGWVSGLTTCLASFLWRFFAAGFSIEDYLRLGDSISLLIVALLSIFILKIFIRKNGKTTLKWTYGIVFGLISECIHIILIFQIVILKYSDIDFAHQIINQIDYILILSTIISVSLAFLWINIYNRQKIGIFKKETKLHANIQKKVALFFVAAFVITYGITYIFGIQKAYYDIKSDLMVNAQDVTREVMDINEETSGLININIIKEITSNRRIRTNGFIVIASAKKQTFLNPENKNSLEVTTEKDDIIATPKKLYTEYVFQKLYFNKNTSDVCDNHLNKTVTFKNKDDKQITCKCSDTFLSKVYDYKNPYDLPYYFVQIIRTGEIQGKGDYYIVTFISMEEATDNAIISLRISMYLEILIYSFIYLLIYRLMKRRVTNNIDSVNQSLNMISSGNLNTKVDVREFDEFDSLSNDINKTVDVLKDYIKQANQRIDDELKYAKAIQMNNIPLVFPVNPNIDLYASMVTAKQVGGDFYDFFFIDDENIFFMVADVSGKGIPAAMFMMRAKTLINALSQTKELPLNVIVDNVNDELNHDNDSGMFVTSFEAILNIKTGKLSFINAGHTRPLIKDNKGNVSYLNVKPNFVLGVMPGFNYALETIYLKPGDQFVLYTDGVTEATDKNKELFGESSLLKFSESKAFKDSCDYVDKLNDVLEKFQNGVEQADDITILSIIYKPNK